MITGPRKSFIGCHVTPNIKNQLKAWAMENGMGLSEYVYHILRKYVDQRVGTPPKNPDVVAEDLRENAGH